MIDKSGAFPRIGLPALGAALIVLATALPPGTGARPVHQATQIALKRSIVVKLTGETTACGDGTVTGTGFAYAPERVMTVAHLVAGVGRPMTVTGPDGARYKGRVVVFDPGRDVAVLRVPGFRPASPAFGPVESGERVTLAGYPKGKGLTITRGTAGRSIRAQGPDIYREREVGRRVLLVNLPVAPGVNGGPLFGPDGTVAGMVFASDTRGRAGFALPVTELARPARDGRTATTTVSTRGCDR
ncbi:trypsin-like peptidase domain-containing protein [Nonomuraea typhae]|uniref:Trypsin-like peptidase domain-containing protein n=1 Tax=Nonomuraea typhae TaxID=2603600 RepID=A0ABW7Z6E1_9ACTN